MLSQRISLRARTGFSLRIDYRFRKTQKAVIFVRENLRADRLVADEASSATSLFFYNRIKQAIAAAASKNELHSSLRAPEGRSNLSSFQSAIHNLFRACQALKPKDAAYSDKSSSFEVLTYQNKLLI